MSTTDNYNQRYDALLDAVFVALGDYQSQMATFEDQQNDGFDLINDAERQAGIFSTQFNSSAYFQAPLSSRYEFKPVTTPAKGTNGGFNVGGTITTRPLLTPTQSQPLKPGDLDGSSDDDSDEDDDVTRIYSPQQLMMLFSVAPSRELSQAQEKWSIVVETGLPSIIAARARLIKAIEAVEEFKKHGMEMK